MSKLIIILTGEDAPKQDECQLTTNRDSDLERSTSAKKIEMWLFHCYSQVGVVLSSQALSISSPVISKLYVSMIQEVIGPK